MNKKELAGWSIAALTAPLLLGAMTMSVVASATGSDDTVPATANSSSAAVTSEVQTEELCTWYMLGAPDSLTLSADVGLEYEGVQMTLSANLTHANSESLTAYASGNLTGGAIWEDSGYTECTFYGEPVRPVITIAVDTTTFSATAVSGRDENLDFNVAVGRELAWGFTTRNGCTAWTTADVTFSSPGAGFGTPMKISTISDVVTPVNQASDTNRCSREASVSAFVPADLNPQYPGEVYTWTGPTVEYVLRTSLTDE